MDILAHSLWAGAGAKKLNDGLEKKSKNKISILWSAIWSIFPDIFAFGVPSLISIYTIIIGKVPLLSLTHHGPSLTKEDQVFDLASYLYQYSHSLIIFFLVFLVVWLLLKRPWLPLLGWGFHILLDIPSHSLLFFPTPFLFPISDYHFPYGVHWSNPIFMIINYLLLLVVFVFFVIKRNKKNDNR